MTNDVNPGSVPPQRAGSMPDLEVRIGDRNVTEYLVYPLSIRRGRGLVNDAEFVLDPRVAESDPLDYVGLVKIVAHWNGVAYPRFTGLVENAWAGRNGIQVKCGSAVVPDLEGVLGVFLHEGVTGAEIMYTISKAAGFRGDQLEISGIDKIVEETVEVLVPIHGIAIGAPITIGPYELVPSSEADWIKTGWSTGKPARHGDPAEVTAAFGHIGAFVRSTCTSSTLYDAEQLAVQEGRRRRGVAGDALPLQHSKLS
jgi:hypothetical protein